MRRDTGSFQLFLESHGVSLADTLSVEAFALSADDALKAIELARENDLVILGGDVYLDRDGEIGPPDGRYAWTTDVGTGTGNSFLVYRDVDKRAAIARAAILKALGPDDERRWYSLVVIK